MTDREAQRIAFLEGAALYTCWMKAFVALKAYQTAFSPQQSSHPSEHSLHYWELPCSQCIPDQVKSHVSSMISNSTTVCCCASLKTSTLHRAICLRITALGLRTSPTVTCCAIDIYCCLQIEKTSYCWTRSGWLDREKIVASGMDKFLALCKGLTAQTAMRPGRPSSMPVAMTEFSHENKRLEDPAVAASNFR